MPGSDGSPAEENTVGSEKWLSAKRMPNGAGAGSGAGGVANSEEIARKFPKAALAAEAFRAVWKWKPVARAAPQATRTNHLVWRKTLAAGQSRIVG